MQNVIIISAELSGLSGRENLARTEELQQILEGIPAPFKSGNGMYKGSSENSFVISLCPNFNIDMGIALATEFGQESVLVVDSGGCGSLMYADGSSKYEILGQLTEVEEATAKARDAYTETDGKFYIIY